MLALTLFTGVWFVAFFVLNGYLLGREYFELAAMRHLPSPQAVELRRRRAFDVFIAGMIVAVFVAVPLLNLFTPLFAIALMTRMMKRLARRKTCRCAVGTVRQSVGGNARRAAQQIILDN